MTILWQVTAPHFCAGLETVSDVVTLAAPILAWTVGKPRAWLRVYFKNKGWQVVRCSPRPC